MTNTSTQTPRDRDRPESSKARASSQKRSLDWKERMLDSRYEERKAVPPGVWASRRWIGLAGLWVFLAVLGRYSVTHHPFSSVTALYILVAATAATIAAAKWLLPR